MHTTCIFLVGSAFPTLAETPARKPANPQVQQASNETVFVRDGGSNLIREIGLGWEFEKEYIEIYDKKSLLYAGRAIGGGDFHLKARLSIRNPDDKPTFVVGGSGSGLNGFRRLTYGYWPREILRHQHLFMPLKSVKPGVPFPFEVIRAGQKVVVLVNKIAVHHFLYGGHPFGKVGFCSYEGALRVHDFSLRGQTVPLNWNRTKPITISTPTVDLSQEEHRQIVVDKQPGQYLGHPDTVLLPDNKTMFCTYPLGHGGPAAVLKKSTDGGLTWSDRLPVPDNWKTATNCPCIHHLTDSDGIERLIVLEGNGDMRQSISTDNGETWTPFEPNGLHCIVVPNRLIPISGGRYLAIYVDHGSRAPGDHVIMQSIMHDGGLTWEKQRLITQHADALPDEPGVIRSPNRRQIAALMREQSRAYNAMVITSDDEGQTWSECWEGAAGVTGDRHNLCYAPDGRLVIVFRDTALASPTKFNFVAWVGTYDELVNGCEGQYHVLLLRHHNNFPPDRYGDCGYAGLEVLPDGTFIATTYVVHKPGEKNSVISVRFTLKELDERVAKSRK